jgi:hypothetical protein
MATKRRSDFRPRRSQLGNRPITVARPCRTLTGLLLPRQQMESILCSRYETVNTSLRSRWWGQKETCRDNPGRVPHFLLDTRGSKNILSHFSHSSPLSHFGVLRWSEEPVVKRREESVGNRSMGQARVREAEGKQERLEGEGKKNTSPCLQAFDNKRLKQKTEPNETTLWCRAGLLLRDLNLGEQGKADGNGRSENRPLQPRSCAN